MAWWQRLWRTPSSPSLAEKLRVVNLTMDGWTEDSPNGDLRVWRNAQGDVLSLAIPDGSLELPSLSDTVGLQQCCRALAESRRAGLIEVVVGTGELGTTVSLIYKRLEMPAYIFTGMLLVFSDEVSQVWTVVSGERGTTGVREAIVTTELMSAGRLTIEDYRRSWAQDPYDANFSGVDRSVLRFVSDDESYDERFPEHPLSKVRRVLVILPSSVKIDSGSSRG
jgi:hypothetical protein